MAVLPGGMQKIRSAFWDILVFRSDRSGGSSDRCLALACVIATGCCITAAAALSQPSSDPFPTYATGECAAHPWIIPFSEGKAELGQFARTRLDELAEAWRTDPGPMLASGRVDGIEEERYPNLARQRLNVLASAMERRGVPRGDLWLRDDGGSNGFSPNEPDVEEPQNRIVLVQLPTEGEQCAHKLAKARMDWLRRNCSPLHPTAAKAACDNAESMLN